MKGITQGWTAIVAAAGLVFTAQAVGAQEAPEELEYFEGLAKVCVYNTYNGRQTMRIPRASRCPRTYRAESTENGEGQEAREFPVFGMLKHKVKRGSEVYCIYSNGLGPDYVVRKPMGSICQITPY